MNMLLTNASWTDISGYVASFLVMISFLFADTTKLRVVNTTGCGLFIIYGVLQSSLPVIITNAGITLINLYHLLRKK